MARGVDLWAAEIVLRQCETNSKIELIAAIPYNGFEKSWCELDKQIYNQILGKAKEVIFVCCHYSRYCFQLRNKYMIDNCSRIIALYNGEKGGTRNTLEYAKKSNIEIVLI